MGQRCNLIIVENGTFKLYYDHWAANRLDDELFWGPEVARSFIEQRDEAPNSWLDEIWCEGGCVLDYDARHMMWYGGEDMFYDPALNIAHAELMASQWEGWTVEWAYDGIFDLARRAGVGRELVWSGKPFEPEFDLTPVYTARGPGRHLVYADGVVSVSKRDARRFGIVCGRPDSLACAEVSDARLFDMIAGFHPKQFAEDVAQDKGWGSYRWGVDLDVDRKHMRLWYSEPHQGMLDHLAHHWPGWTISFEGADYLWHADLLPMLPWPASRAELKLKIISGLRSRLGRRYPNPAVGTVAALKNRKPDQVVEVNPSVHENREHSGGDPSAKRAVLDALEARVRAEIK